MNRFTCRMAVGAVLFAAGMVLHYGVSADALAQLAAFLPAYIVVGYDVVLKAARNIGRGQFFDENLLMVIATGGAFLVSFMPGAGDVMFPEAVAVMLFFQIGEWFEKRAVGKTRESISSLVDLQPDVAHVVRDGATETVDPEEVSVGEIVTVLPGEKVPLDGIIVSGSTTLDTSALTGESMPKDASEGTEVVSGSINLSAKIDVRTTKEYEDSTASKILELVEDSFARKAATEKFITRFARYYTPAVVGAAFLVAVVPSLLTGDWAKWIYRALTFLVVSCPCAVVISVPLSYFCGIGSASRMGILVKGGNFLEALADAKTVVFDKTGTLTKGRFSVSRMHAMDMSEDELIMTAAMAEAVSNHPISKSIIDACGDGFDASFIEEAEEMPGKGVRASVHGKTVNVGNSRLMEDIGLDFCHEEVAGTNVHVAVDGCYAGHIIVSDIVKDDARAAIDELRAMGVEKIAMLSGDAQNICLDIGERLGIDDIRYELLPADKTAALKEIMDSRPSGTVAYVGDGINDAPSLAMSDVGIAMGGLGSDAAIEAADIVIMDDSPSKIPECMRLSKKVRRIVWENIVFALGVKFAILGTTLFGITDMWAAVFGDVGVTVIAIFNAMRCMEKPESEPAPYPDA